MRLRSVNAAVAGVFLLTPAWLLAQSPKIEFEVASIRPVQQGAPMGPRMMQGRLGLRVEGDRANIYFLSVADMVRLAYRAKSYQLLEVNFLQAGRWDVQAKLPEGASREQVPEMVRAMLVDRFKLKAHTETKEQNGYALVVAKDGPKIQPSEGGGFVGESPANALSTQFGSAGLMRLTSSFGASPKR